MESRYNVERTERAADWKIWQEGSRGKQISTYKSALMLFTLFVCLSNVVVGQPFEIDSDKVHGIQTFFDIKSKRTEVLSYPDFQQFLLDSVDNPDPVTFGKRLILTNEFMELVSFLGILPSNHVFGVNRQTQIETDASGVVTKKVFVEGTLVAETTQKTDGEETRIDYTYTSTGAVNELASMYTVSKNGMELTKTRGQYHTQNTYSNGLLEKVEVFWQNELTMRILRSYDGLTGKITQMTSFSPSGSVLGWQKYKYGQSGKLESREDVNVTLDTKVEYLYELPEHSTVKYNHGARTGAIFRLKWESNRKFLVQKDGDSISAVAELNELGFVCKAEVRQGETEIGSFDVRFD